MMNDIQQLWPEIIADFGLADMYWQLLVIVTSILGARLVATALKAYVSKHDLVQWQLGLGGINRVLFPLSSLFFLYFTQAILSIWHHVSLVSLAITAFWAMAIIRLAVYALRYIFAPSGWLSTTENVISRGIWILYVLDIAGILPKILDVMQQIGFRVGKTQLNLLLVVQGLMIIIITLFVALSLSRWLENRLMKVAQVETNVRVALSRVLRVLFSFIAVMLSLSAVGIDLTVLSVFSGALGVGLGFGLQKIASNYVSGFIILLDDSLHIGDVITVDGHYGVVNELRFRYLILRKLDGTQVAIPHETIISGTVINHSHAHGKTRVLLPIQVSYDSDVAQVMHVLEDCARRQSRVLQDMPIEALLTGFADNGISMSLTFWVTDPEDGTMSVQSAVYLDIWNEFKRLDIAIPYPRREVHVTQSTGKSSTKKSKNTETQSNLRWDDVY